MLDRLLVLFQKFVDHVPTVARATAVTAMAAVTAMVAVTAVTALVALVAAVTVALAFPPERRVFSFSTPRRKETPWVLQRRLELS